MSDFANLEDSGLFISVAHEPGIAHPPGYPLYTMLAHLFTWIPLGSIAERVHALSAIAGISSCILLFQISRDLKADSLSALVAASCLGVSSSFWYQAITAEVYTLNTLFFLLLFLLGLKQQKESIKWRWMVMAFISGLSLTNHWPLMLITAPALFLIILPQWKDILRNFFNVFFFFVLGLTPYLYLPVRSWSEPYLTFFQYLPDWERVWWSIKREAYTSGDQSGTWHDSYLFIKQFFISLPAETGWPVLIAGSIGVLVFVFKYKLVISFSVLYTFFSSSVLLKLFYRNEYNPHHWEIHQCFILLPIAMVCLVVAPFITKLKNALKNDKIAQGFSLASIILFVWPLVKHFDEHDLRKDSFPEDVATLILNGLPEHANYFVHGAEELGLVAYANLVKGIRSDVNLYSQNGTLFGNRLFYAGSSPEKIKIQLSDFLNNGESIYAMELRPGFKNSLKQDWSIRKKAGYEIISHKNQTTQQTEIDLNLIEQFMNRWNDGMYGERWKKFRRVLLLRYCKIYMNNKGYHPVFESNPTCGLHYALKLKNEGQFQKAEEILRKIKDDDEFNLFETIEKNAVYRNILHLGLNRINRKVGGLEDKLNDYQKIVNEAFPGIYIDRKCQRVLMNELREIQKQIPVKFTGHFNKDKLEKCNKRTD